MCSCNHGLDKKWQIGDYKYEKKLSDRMIKLMNSVIAKINILICQCLADQLFASALGFSE